MAVRKIRRFDKSQAPKPVATKAVAKNIRRAPRHHKVEVSERVGVRVTAG